MLRVLFLGALILFTDTGLSQEEKKEAKWELKTGGYGQFQYEINTGEALDNLRVRRFRLTFDGKLGAEKLFYRGYIDLDKGKTVGIREAYIGYDIGGPAKFKLTVGQQLVPFSIDHLLSSSKRLIAERSKVTTNLAPGRDIGGLGDRDVGITLYGNYIVDFWVGIFQGGVEIKGGKFTYSETEKIDNYKDIALRAVYKDAGLKGLNIGISYYQGGLSTATVKTEPLVRNRFGGEIAYQSGALSVQSEYIVGEDPISPDKKPLGKTIKKSGYYLQAGYKLIPEIELALRYGSWDPDTDKTDNEETQATLAVNYWASKHSRILLDYTKNIEKPTDKEDDVIILRYQLKF